MSENKYNGSLCSVPGCAETPMTKNDKATVIVKDAGFLEGETEAVYLCDFHNDHLLEAIADILTSLKLAEWLEENIPTPIELEGNYNTWTLTADVDKRSVGTNPYGFRVGNDGTVYMSVSGGLVIFDKDGNHTIKSTYITYPTNNFEEPVTITRKYFMSEDGSNHIDVYKDGNPTPIAHLEPTHTSGYGSFGVSPNGKYFLAWIGGYFHMYTGSLV